jgi:CheY-like chemotaxis protein
LKTSIAMPRALQRRILVVEDDDLLREIFEAVLGLAGYLVEGASNGREALKLFEKSHFDLVITDRDMPELGGDALIRALRRRGIEVPIIIVSSSVGDGELSAGISAEIVAALPKPVSTAELARAVENALQLRLAPISL